MRDHILHRYSAKETRQQKEWQGGWTRFEKDEAKQWGPQKNKAVKDRRTWKD